MKEGKTTRCVLRARRALMLFNDVPLRTRKALSLYSVGQYHPSGSQWNINEQH